MEYLDGIKRTVISVKPVKFCHRLWDVMYIKFEEEAPRTMSINVSAVDELDAVKRMPEVINFNLELHAYDSGNTKTNWKGA